MDERFKKINRLLSDYSLGRFDKRLKLSPRLDEVDAFIAGVNMLGDDLKAITISRNYFTSIFNSVSDMVFILNRKGLVEHANKAAAQHMECSGEALQDVYIDKLLEPAKRPLFYQLKKELKRQDATFVKESLMLTTQGKTIPVHIRASYLQGTAVKRSSILLTAQDITLQKQTKNLIIRTMLDTQEKERTRLAGDLHDSLGQQLSAIKFYISSVMESLTDEEDKEILTRSSNVLTEVIHEMRNICFNLMPRTLEEVGLPEALKEMCARVTDGKKVKVRFQLPDPFPRLPKEMQIDIYRVIQEFISNALRHGKATLIRIKFNDHKDLLKLILQDNGKGFTPSSTWSRGMGLKNMQSRIQSHNGEFTLRSEEGKGTLVFIEIPIQRV